MPVWTREAYNNPTEAGFEVAQSDSIILLWRLARRPMFRVSYDEP
jgi:hypothetical protein